MDLNTDLACLPAPAGRLPPGLGRVGPPVAGPKSSSAPPASGGGLRLPAGGQPLVFGTAFMSTGHHETGTARRDFLQGAAAVLLGGSALLAPAGAGLAVFLHPLHARRDAAGWSRVTRLAALPADGVPRRFTVVADRVNAWNKSPAVPVGAVYLRRTGEATVRAFNVVCPHAGCLVDYAPARGGFLCPCHNSTFAVDGRVNDPASPSPRGLDELEVEIRNDGEVWVRFQNFRTGVRDKIPA